MDPIEGIDVADYVIAYHGSSRAVHEYTGLHVGNHVAGNNSAFTDGTEYDAFAAEIEAIGNWNRPAAALRNTVPYTDGS